MIYKSSQAFSLHFFKQVKVRQSGKQITYGFLNSPIKRTKLTILSKEKAQDSDFRSFLGELRTP